MEYFKKANVKIKIIFAVILIMVFSVIVVGCDSDEKVPEGSGSGKEEVADEVAITPVEEVVGVGISNVSVESTNGAYVQIMPIEWDNIFSQAAYVSHTNNNTGVTVCLANFETSEDLTKVEIGDNQGVVSFSLRIRGGGDEILILPGTYDILNYEEDLFVSPTIRLSGGSALQISQHAETAEFEVTEITEKEIIGNFNFQDQWTKMSGEFRVPFVE